MAVWVENGELSAAIPIDLRSPLNRHKTLNPVMFCQSVGNLNPHCHPSWGVVCASRHQLQSNAVSLEDRKAVGLGRLVAGTSEAEDFTVKPQRWEKH